MDGPLDLRDIPWIPGVAAGLASWGVGYALMAALFYVGPPAIAGGTHLQRLRHIGMIFYNAHLVDGVVTVGGQTSRLNAVISQTGSQVPTAVYFAIPLLTLFAAGLVVAYQTLDLDGVTEAPALVGLAMTGGYLVPAVAMTFVVELPVLGGLVVLHPDRLQTVAFFGAVPFLVGTVGALVGTLLD